MYYALFVFILAFMSAIRCVPLVNLKTSDNLQNSSTISEILNTFDDLNTLYLLCNEDNTNSYYCNKLINENGVNSPIKYIIQTKIDVIQSSLLKLLNLENKAIVCRGMRHLLPIIMLGIIINNSINGSKGIGNSGKHIFDELFEKKFDFLNDKNSSIEKKLQEIKVSTVKNSGTNNKLDGMPEQSKEFTVTNSSIMKNIMTIVQLILPFIKELDYFHNLYKINKVWTVDKYDCILLLLLIFDEIKSMYRTECYADVDGAALLQNRDGGWKFELNYDSIPLLVGEINRLSVEMQKDLELLFEKFIFANNPKNPLQQYSNVSMVFYHTINKYHDPEVWRLIGNETIVDHSYDFGKTIPTSIEKVMLNVSKMIQRTKDSLIELLKKTITCRSYAYLNLSMKLFYCSMHILVVNVSEIQRSIQAFQKYNNNKFYDLLLDKNKMKELGTAECFNGDDVGAINELLDRNDIDEHFRNVYADFWNKNADYVNNAIDNVWEYLSVPEFEVEYNPIVQDIDRIQIYPKIEMKSVEFLFSRYKLVEQTYKDHCSPDSEYVDNVSTFSDDIKQALQVTTNNTRTRLTLEWIVKMTITIQDELQDDLDNFISQYLNV